MEKKTVMLTNFKKIQEDLNNLAQEYKIAKDNNDEKKLNNCTKQYEELKTLLRSNAYYFNNLNVTEINNKLEVIDNEEEIGHLKAKKAEKNVYKSNKYYISMVEKADDLDTYIQKNSQKKINFVKKHFKPIVLGAAAIMLLGSIAGCANRKTKEGYATNETIKEQQTTNEPIINEEDTYEITTESLNDLVDSKDDVKINTKEDIKLNPLEESSETKTTDKKSNIEDKKDNVSYTNKNVGTVGTGSSLSTGKTTTTTKSLDPHTSQKEAETKKTTITTETIKQESVKEPTAVDYPTTIIDNTNKNTTEKTSYEYKEETTNKNTSTELPIVEPTTTQPTTEPLTNEEEIIIIEENVEEEDTYNGDVIDDTYGYALSYRRI